MPGTIAVLAAAVAAASSLPAKGSAAVTNAPPARAVGWPESGEIPLAFAQAKITSGTRLAREGWRHLHTIRLSKDRELEAWDRGREELTIMFWRITAGRTGFSRGLTLKRNGAK